MGKSVFAGFVGAAAMFIAMSVMGATHQSGSSSVEKKLDQLRAVMIMSHHKEIQAFLKPMAGPEKPSKELVAAMVPFYGAIEDLGKDDEGAAMYYVMMGKTPPEKAKGK
jgi:hypothetical protein